jgi:hypothetical protein
MAMNNLFRTKTLASRAELGLEIMQLPFLAVPRQPDPAIGLVGGLLLPRREQGIGFKFSLY